MENIGFSVISAIVAFASAASCAAPPYAKLFANSSVSVSQAESNVSQLQTIESSPTLFAEDLKIGDRWATELREVSAEDVAQFAELTGGHTPLHGDDAAASPYGKPIAHGLLGLSLLAGLGFALGPLRRKPAGVLRTEAG